MNNIPNRQVICETLMELAAKDRDIVVLCSDSRGSASLAPFADAYPKQFVETGIAEQNLVSVAAGLARCGKKPYAASPACFLSTRSMEQAKVDVAYSGMDVKLIGISGGISYGALGMTHHSAQDIAVFGSMPGMRVYLPSDRHQTRAMMQALANSAGPAYIRVGRGAVEDIYTEKLCPFTLGKATILREGGDALLIACGETVKPALDASALLQERGISTTVLDIHSVKPIDAEAILSAARNVRAVITIEEHSVYGGLGAMVSQLIGANCPRKVVNWALPDASVIAGKSSEVFAYYGLDAKGIARICEEALSNG